MTYLPIVATLTQPLHHGAGSSGNTSLLRTQDITLPDGTQASTPFVSGNSIRHALRAALAWHATRVLDIADGALSRPVVDLLWSGGALTETGARVDLELARRREALFPTLGLFGYSARSDLVAGHLFVDHLHLICAENAWRLPPQIATSPSVGKGAAAYRGEEFGTRHDVIGSGVDRYVELVEGTDPTSTTQMIYDVQTIIPGAQLAGGVGLAPSATAAHRQVLAVALDEWAPVIDGHRTARIGAKSAVGFGGALIDVDTTSIDPDGTARTWWETHLADHRDEIIGMWMELAG